MCFVVFASASAQSPKVIIGYANFSPTYAPVWVAKEMGFFDKHHLNADIIFIRGGAMATQALDGKIHVIYTYRRYSFMHLEFNEDWLTRAERPD
jgi:ABC-type nitrate/sulfonate/bicarbonate transport system substrate-binding protein